MAPCDEEVAAYVAAWVATCVVMCDAMCVALYNEDGIAPWEEVEGSRILCGLKVLSSMGSCIRVKMKKRIVFL